MKIRKKQKKSGDKKVVKKYSRRSVPSVWWLLKASVNVWWDHPKKLASVLGIYGSLHFILVKGLSAIDVQTIQQNLAGNVGQGAQDAVSSFILTGGVLGVSGGLDDVSSVYKTILLLVNGLAIIWLLRRIMSKKSAGVREAFYQGMTPLVPVIIVLAMLIIQLVPLLIGVFIAGTIFANGIAITGPEQVLTASVFILGLLVSIYFMTGSIIASVIATNPGMRPWQAYLSARELLRGRRLVVTQRLLFFGLITALSAFSVLLLAVAFSAGTAIAVSFVMTILIMPWTLTYVYVLYRKLLEDEA